MITKGPLPGLCTLLWLVGLEWHVVGGALARRRRNNGGMAFWRGLMQPIRYAALLAGALPVLAFPAPNLEFLAWFGLVPGLFIMRASLAARGGVWMVSFAIVAAKTGIVILLAAARTPVRALGAVAVALVIVAGPAAFARAPAPHPARFVTVTLVQPGIQHNPLPRVNASERLSRD